MNAIVTLACRRRSRIRVMFMLALFALLLGLSLTPAQFGANIACSRRKSWVLPEG
jgi:hypothetical protein